MTSHQRLVAVIEATNASTTAQHLAAFGLVSGSLPARSTSIAFDNPALPTEDGWLPAQPDALQRVIPPASAHWEGVNAYIFSSDGAAQESNLPSRGLHDLTGFEDRLGHRARAAPRMRVLGSAQ